MHSYICINHEPPCSAPALACAVTLHPRGGYSMALTRWTDELHRAPRRGEHTCDELVYTQLLAAKVLQTP